MICPNCNAENSDGSLFCHDCGTKLEPTTEGQSTTYTAPINHNGASAQNQGTTAYGGAQTTFTQNQAYCETGTQTANVGYNAPAPNYGTYNYAQNAQAVNKDSRNGFAIASFVISLLNLICCLGLAFPVSIAGLVFGIMGTKSNRKGFSIAGIIINILSLLVFVMIVVFYFWIIAQVFSAFSSFDMNDMYDMYDYYEYLPNAGSLCMDFLKNIF